MKSMLVRVARRALWPLAILALLLGVILISPSRWLIDNRSDDHGGWSLGTRSMLTIAEQGWFHTGAEFQLQGIAIGEHGSTSVYCPTSVTHGYGPIAFRRDYHWTLPDNTDACPALRHKLLTTPGTLAAALLDGDPETVKAHLDDALVSGRALAVRLAEVGEPLRSKLSRLLLLPEDSTVLPLSRVDVALAIGATEGLYRWLYPRGPGSRQRHALFRLGKIDLVTRFPGGFGHDDYYIANAHCDSQYAAFLADRGIAPDEDVVIQAFLGRLYQESPDVFRDMDFVHRQELPATATGATPQACATLMKQYRQVALSARTVRYFSNMAAMQVLDRFQALAANRKQGRTFENRAEVDRFYAQLPFNQQTSPLPSLPGMFVTLLKGRASGPAICAALDALPWLKGHDRATALFADLARSWNGKTIHHLDYLTDRDQCRPELLLPPSLYPQETRHRNAFLQRIGLDCQVVTPDVEHPYEQYVVCTDPP